jgi:putative membrane protein
MKLPIIVASVSALILAGCAHKERESTAMGAPGPVTTSEQSGTGQSYLGEPDQTFLKEASQAGMAEVQMGRLAAQKGHSHAVRQLGQKLVQDHSKANQELKLLASQKSVTLPTDTPTEAESMLAHLRALEGAEFDKELKKHAIEGHQKAIQQFQTAAQSADSDVKAFAEKTLPVLKEHLKMAEAIKADSETSTPTQTQTPTQSQPNQTQPESKQQ